MKASKAAAWLRSMVLLCALQPTLAQRHSALTERVESLNLQFHGYATQAFIYSNQNNWNTTNSTDGSFAWTEGVANVGAQPHPRLRLGAQVRFFRLGAYGKNVRFDWASGEFKFNERFAVRAGKIKTPSGLLNEVQDIDPSHLWILLPSSVYPVAGRDANLTHDGVVGLGTVSLGEKLGKLEYRAFVGERVIPSGDGYLEPLSTLGFSAPSGLKGRTYGGSLRWRTPVPGLILGAADASVKLAGPINLGPYGGTLTVRPFSDAFFFGQYERRKLMLAGEYNRIPVTSNFMIPGILSTGASQDQRNFYVMASYKVASRATVGAYYSSSFNRPAPLGSARYQKDWTVAARYELTSFLYVKVEQHFIDGVLSGFSASNNPGGLAETSRLSLAKLGVSF